MVELKIDDNLREDFIFYDIETLPKDYTIVAIDGETRIALIYAKTQIPFDREKAADAILKANPQVHRVVFSDDYAKVRNKLLFEHFRDHKYRGGWNSLHFDLPVMFATDDGLPSTARHFADQIIAKHMRPSNLTYPIFTSSSHAQPIDKQGMRSLMNSSMHVDISVLNEKSGDVDADSKARTPASLKMVSAYAGLDVLDDDITRIDFDVWDETGDVYYEDLPDDTKAAINPDQSLTEHGLINLLVYNTKDVVNTGILLNQPEYISGFKTKKNLIEKYQLNKNGDVVSPSATSARISEEIITQFSRPQDIPEVNFMFPFPDGVYRDLLEYLRQQKIIPMDVYKFYDNIRGMNVDNKENAAIFIKKGDATFTPAQHEGSTKIAPDYPYGSDGASKTNSTLSVPYFDANFKPISSFNTFSRGGAHGTTAADTSAATFDDARLIKWKKPRQSAAEKASGAVPEIEWTYAGDAQSVIQKRTRGARAWAIDADSFYPTFLSKLGVYQAPDGSDVYNDIRTERLALKHSLPDNSIDYTPEDVQKNVEQKDSKLVLNAASGASNKMSPWAKLKLDNKIVSMRCMGNLFIYALATAFVRRLNAEVFSTNTDGIEISFDHLPENQQPDREQIEAVAQDVTEEFGFKLEPEYLSFFITKDSNNRVEWHGDTINKCSGKLSKGFRRNGRIGLDSKLDHPIVTDMAVLAYFQEFKDSFLDEKIIKPTKTRQPTPHILQWFENWISNHLENDDLQPMEWCLFTKGNNTRKFYLDDEVLQDNNRYIYAKNDGGYLKQLVNGKPTKITGWTSDYAKILNTHAELEAMQASDIDVKPYALWAYNTLVTWANKEQTRPDKVTKQASSLDGLRKNKPAKVSETPADDFMAEFFTDIEPDGALTPIDEATIANAPTIYASNPFAKS